MTKNKFIELVIDKVILASLIASFGTAALFGYNLFNKAFESAREQSKAFSSFAVENKIAILGASKEMRTILTGLHYRSSENETNSKDRNDKAASKAAKPPETASPKGSDATDDGELSGIKKQREMVRQLVQMESAINGLNGLKTSVEGKAKSTFERAGAAAKDISAVFRQLVASFRSTGEGSLPSANVLEDFKKVNQAEARFVEEFNSELGAALAMEFSQFYESYYSSIPWYGRPIYLMAIALAALIGCCIAYFLLPPEAPAPAAPAPSAPKVFVRLVR